MGGLHTRLVRARTCKGTHTRKHTRVTFGQSRRCSKRRHTRCQSHKHTHTHTVAQSLLCRKGARTLRLVAKR